MAPKELPPEVTKTLVEFDTNAFYDYVFRHITYMVENIKDKQMQIHYCEEKNAPAFWKLWNVQTGKVFDNDKLTSKTILMQWTPNKYNAGSTFRVLIAKILAYQFLTYGEDSPSPPPADTPDKDRPRPGVE